MTRLDSYKEHVEPLIGFRLLDVDVEDCEHGDPWTILKVQRGDEKLNLVVSQDPEGNGGGFLFIECQKTLCYQGRKVMGKFSNNEAIDIEDRLGDLLPDKSNSEALEIIEKEFGSFQKTYAEYLIDQYRSIQMPNLECDFCNVFIENDGEGSAFVMVLLSVTLELMTELLVQIV